MSERRWIDASQPQALRNGVVLAYLNAAWSVIYFLSGGGLRTLVFATLGIAAFGIANDRRQAYVAAVVLGGLSAVVQLGFLVHGPGQGGIFNLLFTVAMLALLLHPESREYQRIWFH